MLDEAPERHFHWGAPSTGVFSIDSLSVATQPILGPNSDVVGYIQYARSDERVSETITKLWLLIVGGILGGTALAILGGLALASRAMRPIAALTSTAREITATRDLSQRLPPPVAEDEVAELTETLQGMLAALEASQTEREAAMQKQREFVADASHELRTPLTSILANLELLEAQFAKLGESEEHEIVTSAVRSSKRMSRLVTDLLVLARSDAASTGRRPSSTWRRSPRTPPGRSPPTSAGESWRSTATPPRCAATRTTCTARSSTSSTTRSATRPPTPAS